MSAFPPTVPYTPPEKSEVRPLPAFLPAVVREQIETDLEALKDGERVAFIAGIDRSLGRLAILVRGNSHWSFSGYLAQPWGGSLEYGAKIVVAF